MQLVLKRQSVIASVWRTRRVKTDKGLGDSPGKSVAAAAASTTAALDSTNYAYKRIR